MPAVCYCCSSRICAPAAIRRCRLVISVASAGGVVETVVAGGVTGSGGTAPALNDASDRIRPAVNRFIVLKPEGLNNSCLSGIATCGFSLTTGSFPMIAINMALPKRIRSDAT